MLHRLGGLYSGRGFGTAVLQHWIRLSDILLDYFPCPWIQGNTAKTTLSSVSVGLVVARQLLWWGNQVSLSPLCLAVYKLIGFGVEVLVWAEDPSDWVELGDNVVHIKNLNIQQVLESPYHNLTVILSFMLLLFADIVEKNSFEDLWQL